MTKRKPKLRGTLIPRRPAGNGEPGINLLAVNHKNAEQTATLIEKKLGKVRTRCRICGAEGPHLVLVGAENSTRYYCGKESCQRAYMRIKKTEKRRKQYEKTM